MRKRSTEEIEIIIKDLNFRNLASFLCDLITYTNIKIAGWLMLMTE